LIKIKGLTKVYGTKYALKDIDLEVEKGELFAYLGPNGAGKTTTFYMIIGIVKPDRGRILFDGEDLTSLPMYKRARKGIHYLPQETSVFRRMTVEENILAILETLSLSPVERQRRLRKLLKELRLEHLAKNKASTLSGGERRRVEITRALVTSPHFMILDEPFAGVDPIAVTEIKEVIKRLKDQGMGILISDHNVRETLKVCDRAYILNEGKILEAGTPEKIVNSPLAKQFYLGQDFTL